MPMKANNSDSAPPELNRDLYRELCFSMRFNENIFEILYVYHSIKQAARLIVFSDRDLKELSHLLKSHRLAYAIQDYKVKVELENDKCRYTNRGLLIPLSERHGSFIVYISRHITFAERAKRLERLNNTHFGKILGYPSCCIDFYLAELKREPENHEFSIKSPWELRQYPFVNNQFLRYLDKVILSHFLCSPGCGESEEIGRERFALIERYDPDKAQTLRQELSSLVIYTKNDGLLYTPDYSLSADGVIGYENLKSTEKDTDLSMHFKRNNSIRAKSYCTFEAGGRLFEGGEALVAMFR